MARREAPRVIGRGINQVIPGVIIEDYDSELSDDENDGNPNSTTFDRQTTQTETTEGPAHLNEPPMPTPHLKNVGVKYLYYSAV